MPEPISEVTSKVLCPEAYRTRLTAGLLSRVPSEAELRSQNRSPFDRLFQRDVDDLDALNQFSDSLRAP
jgi:hypothetical protein